MADEFTEARRKKIEGALTKAAKDLIEMDAVPFAEFQTEIAARGSVYTLFLKFEARK